MLCSKLHCQKGLISIVSGKNCYYSFHIRSKDLLGTVVDELREALEARRQQRVAQVVVHHKPGFWV